MSDTEYEENHWIDNFGEHVEVSHLAHGLLFSRKITRDPYAGWTVTWDEARASVEAP